MSRNYVPPKLPQGAPGSAYTPLPSRRRRGRARKALLLAATFLLVAGGTAAVLIYLRNAPSDPVDDAAFTPPATRPATRPAAAAAEPAPVGAATRPSTRDALPPDPTPPDSPVNAEIRRMFDKLGDAVAAQNAAAVREFFDTGRFEAEIATIGRKEGLVNARRQGPQIETVLRNVAALPPQRSDVDKRQVRLRKVTISPAGDEALVVVRSSARPTGKSRWWLRKSGGTWRWYDFEAATDGLRASEMVAVNLPAAPAERLTDWVNRAPDFAKLFIAWGGRDYPAIRRAIEATNGVAYPPRLRAARMFFGGVTSLSGDDNPDAAVAALTNVRDLGVDAPHALLYLATAQNAAHQPDQALGSLYTYREQIGEDAAADYQRGLAHEQLKDRDQAIIAYRRGLAESPGDEPCCKALERLSPDDPGLK